MMSLRRVSRAYPMNLRPRHRGYVLLLTLLLLAIAAAALAGVCRAGLQQAVQAARAQEDLQRRWGVLSCRAALLPKAPKVLAAPRPKNESPDVAEARISLLLGGQSVTLVFGDEQAKANVNLMYALNQRAGADRAVRELAQLSGSPILVELHPLEMESTDESDSDEKAEDEALDVSFQPFFESWGQIFPAAGPDELVHRRGDSPSVTSNLTCWSDGSLNVRRATREALTRACEPVLGPAHVAKLVSAREKDPEFDLWDTLDALNLSESRRQACDLLLTDESTCFSLWIVTRAGTREWYDLSVADVEAGRATGIRVFSW